MKRIFVSSTFKDMHEERDILHYHVLPELNNYAKSTYGESMELCDLRWGINTVDFGSEEASLRVLSVCLDEVESCKPYMIVILGDRYGWIPDETEILNAVKKHDAFLLQDLKKSVTALEIEFGVLQNKEHLAKTLFYFRTIEGNCPSIYRPYNEEDRVLQEKLKEKIKQLAPNNIREYTVQWNEETQKLDHLDVFETMIKKDIQCMMEKEWQNNAAMSSLQRNLYLQQDFADQKASILGGRDWVMERCLWHLEKGTRHILISGDVGSGKTTVMGALSAYLRKHAWKAIPLFVGIHAGTDKDEELLQYLTWQMGEQNEDRLAILIDGINETYTRDIAVFMKKIYSYASEKVAIICSSSPRYSIRTVETSNGTAEIKKIELYPLGKRKKDYIADAQKQFHMDLKEQLETINPWGQDDGVIPKEASEQLQYQLDDYFEVGVSEADVIAEKTAVIQGILKYHKKELDQQVTNAILEKQEADSPFYLSLLIQRLIMMNRTDFMKITKMGDGIENIIAYQLRLIKQAPGNISELCVWLVNAVIAQIGTPSLKDALYFLAMTDIGLCEKDLETLMLKKNGTWNALEFTLLVRYMGTVFTRYNDGRYTFSNKILRDGFRNDCKNPIDFHKGLLQYIKTLSPEHMLRISESITHCYHADDKSFFLQHLTQYDYNLDAQIVVMDELQRIIQNDAFRDFFDRSWELKKSKYLYWLVLSLESVQNTELCDNLIAALAPFAEQLFFENVYYEKANALGRALVQLAEKSTNRYQLAWILTIHAKHLLRVRPYLRMQTSDGSDPFPLAEAKESCAKAARLLEALAKETSSQTAYVKELTECYSVSGEVAAVSGHHEEAFLFYERAEHFSGLYENDSDFLENEGDMLLFTGKPENCRLAIEKYSSIKLDIENEPRILAKLYLCYHSNAEQRSGLLKKADLWKQKMQDEYGTQNSMKFLQDIIQAEIKHWRYRDFQGFTSKLQTAVDELFHLSVKEYDDIFLDDSPEEDSVFTLKNKKGKTRRLRMVDWVEQDDKEYVITSGVFMGQFTGSTWVWRVEDSSNPDYSLEFIREKDPTLVKRMDYILNQRMMNGDDIIGLNIIRFRSKNFNNSGSEKPAWSLTERWYL